MAQQKPDSPKADEQTQVDKANDSDNPQLLNTEMAKAFQELAQGERTASALEAKLDGIHRNLDQLLASFEEIAQSRPGHASKSPTSHSK